MKQRFLSLIEEIRLLQHPYQIQPPALASEVAALKQRATNELDYSPPEFYLELLQVTDGMDCNGNQLYGSLPQKIAGYENEDGYVILGLIEANLLWRDYPPNKKYIFFAESGDRLYCHNLANGKFESVDRITKELTYAPSSFDTCEELLELLLNHTLDRYGDDKDTEN